jgi:hypothetical protein
MLALLLAASSARGEAVDCSPSSGISTCIDANALWIPAGRPRFAAIAPAIPMPDGVFAFGAALVYLSRPIVLVAPSPDPEGREIRVVDDRVDASLLWAYAPSARLELTLATPFVLNQNGAGGEGVASQSAPPLARTAARDPRIGAGYAIGDWDGAALQARTELTLPLGEEQLYAGDGSFVLAPSLAAALALGPFFAGAELGARLRKSVPLADVRFGSQAVAALGAGVDLLPAERLSFGVEAIVMPSLVRQERARGDASLVPAEWLASVRSAPLSDRALLLQLAGGTGLPLFDDELALTSPRFRLLLAVRYAPVGKD